MQYYILLTSRQAGRIGHSMDSRIKTNDFKKELDKFLWNLVAEMQHENIVDKLATWVNDFLPITVTTINS